MNPLDSSPVKKISSSHPGSLEIPESSHIAGIYSLSREELIQKLFSTHPQTKIQYHSLKQIPSDPMDLMFAKSNFGFWWRYIQILLRARKLAQKGEFQDKEFFSFSLDFLHTLEKFGGRFHITGIQNLLFTEGPVVIAGNHMSVLETFVLPAIIGPQKQLTFVVKDSLVNNPLFGDVMMSRNPIPLGRTNPREDFMKVMEEGQKRLEEGISVAIFPQATRDPVLRKSEFNSIATKLAKKAKVPIIPVALKTDFWLPRGIIKDLGKLQRNLKIHFSIGEPISPEISAKDTQEKVVSFIASELKFLGGVVES